MAEPKGYKSVQASWCLFRDHETVRLAVKRKKELGNFKIMDLERMTGIPAYRISRYLLHRKPNVNQYQLYKLCDALDIDIKLVVEFRA